MKTALTSLAIAAACVVGASGTAAAGPASSDRDFTLNFRYAKAELATPEGQKALLSRLETRVRQSCTPAGTRYPVTSRNIGVCVDKTIKKAIGKFNSEALASLYTSRTAG